MDILIDLDWDQFLLAEGSLYSKRFFSDFQRVLLKNKKEGLNALALNYQFTHEYKKMNL